MSANESMFYIHFLNIVLDDWYL